MKNDMRLIDTNALMLEPDEHNVMNGIQFKGRRAGKTIAMVQNALKLMINSAPTVDAVPVVRCKNCQHARELADMERVRFTSDCMVCEHPYGTGVSYPEYALKGRVVWKDSYCSYGDLKTKKEEDR